jgi:cytochrome c oxidase assembly protein Cox11
MVGMSYLAVPLYQIFCQKFGLAGTTQVNILAYLTTEFNYVKHNQVYCECVVCCLLSVYCRGYSATLSPAL